MTESERSVAVGPPRPSPPTNGHAAAARPRCTAPARLVARRDRGDGGRATAASSRRRTSRTHRAAKCTQSPLIPPPPGEAPTRHRRPPPRGRARRRARRGRRGGDGARARGSATGPARATRPAPLSESDVRDVAQDFAQAYEAEDGAALRRTLTPGVAARAPERRRPRPRARRQRVRAPVPRAGHARLRARGPRGAAAAGPAARAAATASSRKGRDAIEGRIVFGVVRDRGQPRIALIAVTPVVLPARARNRRADHRQAARPLESPGDCGSAPCLAAPAAVLECTSEAHLSRRGRRRRGRWCRAAPRCPPPAPARRRRGPSGTSESRKPPPRLRLEAEAAALGPALGVVDAGADEVRDRHPLLARDAEGGERRRAVARPWRRRR